MKIVITGGAGFVGSMLARALLAKGNLTNALGELEAIKTLVILDMVTPVNLPKDPRLEIIVGQANDENVLKRAVENAHCVFHFASVVSGQAEADLALGLAVNLDGTRALLDILAASENCPKLIFSSSLAVFGDGADLVTDTTAAFPRSSYGVQKVCCELLIGDYSRRGLIDGRVLRFPTIAIRPGKPNRANSSFISSIIREPMAEKPAICPVDPELEITLLSPGRLIEAIVKVHEMANEDFGWPRSLILPSIKVSVGDMLDALVKVGGEKARALVSFDFDENINAMVKTWPINIRAERAQTLGLEANQSALEIVQEYLSDHS